MNLLTRTTSTSDPSGSYDVAGVLMFGVTDKRKHAVDGLFWQLSWEEWRKRCANIDPGSEPSDISTAEFLAALITGVSFASYCTGQIANFSLDDSTVKGWFAKSRCTRFSIDMKFTTFYMLVIE